MPAPDLRSLDDDRAGSAQIGIGFEQNILFFIQLEIQRVTGVILAARIDMQREIFAVCQPIFLAGLKRFVRLADELELIVTEKVLEGLFEFVQLGRNRRRLRNIFGNDQSAPDRVGRIKGRCARRQREANGKQHGL